VRQPLLGFRQAPAQLQGAGRANSADIFSGSRAGCGPPEGAVPKAFGAAILVHLTSDLRPL